MILKEKLQGLLYLMCEIGDAGPGAWATCTISGINSLNSKMEFQISVDDLIALTDGLGDSGEDEDEGKRRSAISQAVDGNTAIDDHGFFDISGFERDLLALGYKVVKA
jgi:hypothetical protein